jgi:hypothetical protein
MRLSGRDWKERKLMRKQIKNKLKKTTDKLKQNKKFAGIGGIVLALVIATLFIVTGRPKQATAGTDEIMTITAPETVITGQRQHMAFPVILNDGFVVAQDRGTPMANEVITKNAEVTLTADQINFVQNFGKYLEAIGQKVVVTSGERSPEGQLDLIKDRIEERNANAQFPELASATLADTSTWLKAWQWLRARHVPVNAPAEVEGVRVNVSNHLKGLAIDFIGPQGLDRLRSQVMSFAHSKFGKSAKLAVTTIAREPGCVHVNLRQQG